MDPKFPVAFKLNGVPVQQDVSARSSLADMLRHQMGLTATRLGCEQGSCGACTVLMDGRMVRACLILAIQLDGNEIETSEGFGDDALMDRLRRNFAARNALQCGFCTGGMLIAARDLLLAEPQPDRARIREKISGNFCRCTGYQAIVDAIWQTAQESGAQT
jgi:aerobic carbon-monoxide dehydrogenase small subunit